LQLMVVSLAHQYIYDESLQCSGVVIPYDPAIITPAIRRAILEKRFEAEEAARVPEIVRHGDRVLEIGAGIGFMSTLLSRQRRVASIVAVEANPHLIDYMARLHACNGVTKVRRLNAVLTNEPVASRTFYLRRDFWMGSLLPGPNPWLDTVSVPTANFDALLRDEGVSLIVCDIEGAESFIFEDASLDGVDRILVEVHDHVTGLSGVGAMFRTLYAKGFVYDPRHSAGSVILFQRVGARDIIRPYAG
jgi:FkbM family methyltransferase